MPAAGVVIPAHDEAAVIERNLRLLLSGVEPGVLEVVVVANGCSDDTAEVARSVGGVRVVEIEEPSKARALMVGNAALNLFPRVQVDADCAIAGPDVLRIVESLARPGIQAAGPARRVELSRSSRLVRAYYRVWERLPHVRQGLFGRGVIALSEEGQARVDGLPPMMSDDLGVSEAFSPEERVVVDSAVVVVRAPRTFGDLIRRRIRVATGNTQADREGVRPPGAGTSIMMLVRLGLADPKLAPDLLVFLGTTVVARSMSRRRVRAGDYSTWLRDESSRTA
ncbi:hypothetical protein GCM10007979_00900 [Nocardioides albus]|nr:hypothetical protein GCM10007979_00900 [Nocardioides albus]